MDNEKDKLESLFKKRFENEELPIPEGMWERVRPVLPPPSMPAEQKTDGGSIAGQATPWAKIISAFVIATFLSVTAIYLVTKRKTTKNQNERNVSRIEVQKNNNTSDVSTYSDEDENIEHYSSNKNNVNTPDAGTDSYTSSSGANADFTQSSENLDYTPSDLDQGNQLNKQQNKFSGSDSGKDNERNKLNRNSKYQENKSRRNDKSVTGKDNYGNETPSSNRNNSNKIKSSESVSLDGSDSEIKNINTSNNSNSASNTNSAKKNTKADTEKTIGANTSDAISINSGTQNSSGKVTENSLSTTSYEKLAQATDSNTNNSSINVEESVHKNSLEGNLNTVGSKDPKNPDSKRNDSKSSESSGVDEVSYGTSETERNTPSNGNTNNSAVITTNSASRDQSNTNKNPIANTNVGNDNSSQSNSVLSSDNKSTVTPANALSDSSNTTSKNSPNNSVVVASADSMVIVDSVAIADSIAKEKAEESKGKDSSANQNEKTKQWRGNWIVEMSAGPSLFQKNSSALSNSSGLTFEPSKVNPGISLQLDVFRKLKNNFMLGTGISYQRNAYNYSATQSRDEQYTYNEDSITGYVPNPDTTSNIDSIPVTVSVSKNGIRAVESSTKNVIISQRWQIPVSVSYQWRSGRIGMFTSLDVLFTYYKFSSTMSQSGSDTKQVETPATPKNKMTVGIGGIYGVRYFLNKNLFISGKVAYQSNFNAPMPKSILSLQAGVGFEF